MFLLVSVHPSDEPLVPRWYTLSLWTLVHPPRRSFPSPPVRSSIPPSLSPPSCLPSFPRAPVQTPRSTQLSTPSPTSSSQEGLEVTSCPSLFCPSHRHQPTKQQQPMRTLVISLLFLSLYVYSPLAHPHPSPEPLPIPLPPPPARSKPLGALVSVGSPSASGIVWSSKEGTGDGAGRGRGAAVAGGAAGLNYVRPSLLLPCNSQADEKVEVARYSRARY